MDNLNKAVCWATALVVLLAVVFAPSGHGQSNVTGPVPGPNLIYPPNLVLKDEFPQNANTTGAIGELGWSLRNVGGNAGVASYIVGAYPNLGLFQLTSADATHSYNMTLDGGPNDLFSNMTTFIWDESFIANISAITGIEFRVGNYIANTTTAIPTGGHYWRFDTTLKDVASGTCNDAGNKCGLTTLTCASTQTVLFTIPGGTATGSVACTGTNAIANSTAITVVAAGAGYNSTAAPTTGVTTGGTATFTGSLTITYVLGAAASGSDTHWNVCSDTASVETCLDTGTAPVAASFYRFRIQNVSTSGLLAFTLYTLGQPGSTTTICTAGCSLTATPNTIAISPGFDLLSSGGGSVNTQIDYWSFFTQGLTR